MSEGSIKISNQKKQETWNPLVLEKVHQKFGFTKFYIRQCLRGDRNNETSDAIQKEYKRLCKEVEAVLNK